MALLGFMAEHAVVETVPIFLAVIVAALLLGPALKELGAKPSARVGVYSLFGVAAGLWSYSAFAIPERSLAFKEGAILASGMFLYAAAVTGLVTMIRSRKRRAS